MLIRNTFSLAPSLQFGLEHLVNYLYLVEYSMSLSFNLIFKNSIPNTDDVVNLMKLRMTLWVKERCNLVAYSVEDFKSHLEGIRKHKI
ncbi:hypothetical protein RHMOL_Rhmol07G0276600 [Rhododendron molle]|uniref:Uncharacterized protein n=1 Tax=Rhododendron molle TaxID=49168 RepID=A0ACC0N6W7_RHOML|nr:hypothetical protein RHMOL_Rhmol07G0276600 [Rhododendron molle]